MTAVCSAPADFRPRSQGRRLRTALSGQRRDDGSLGRRRRRRHQPGAAQHAGGNRPQQRRGAAQRVRQFRAELHPQRPLHRTPCRSRRAGAAGKRRGNRGARLRLGGVDSIRVSAGPRRFYLSPRLRPPVGNGIDREDGSPHGSRRPSAPRWIACGGSQSRCSPKKWRRPRSTIVAGQWASNCFRGTSSPGRGSSPGSGPRRTGSPLCG